jgi:CubicO group peptidase (beta-lactamase class C family)
MLMEGTPPPEDARVTLGNWQEPPYNRWSFSHLREVVPTQRISRGWGPAAHLIVNHRPLDDVPVHRVDDSDGNVEEVLESTYTDAVIVLHRGDVVYERYWGETKPDTPHLIMSISKSIVGCVTANLEARGEFRCVATGNRFRLRIDRDWIRRSDH